MTSVEARNRRFAEQPLSARDAPLVTVTAVSSGDAGAFAGGVGTGGGPALPTSSVPESPPWQRGNESDAAIRDGRYRGGTGGLDIELRVDAAVSRILSADLFARTADGGSSWIASLRTRPAEPFSPDPGQWAFVATDRAGAVSSGQLALQAPHDGGLWGELVFDQPLEGLPWGRPILFGLEWQSSRLRRLGLEIESEESVDPPPEILFNNAPMSIEHALGNAGIETWPAGLADLLPAPSGHGSADQIGWSEKDLEGLMRGFAQSPLDRPGFDLRLLWLSRSNRRGLLGIMFDSEDSMQRQGIAVFAEEIRGRFRPADVERKLIQTTVHEIGHALNLAHRFERIVGRADSTSFMNYDWRYRGGERAREYWERFAFSFDEDELAFLRHGPFPALAPGGHAFHTAHYWAEGNGGHMPYLGDEVPLPGFQLELLPPQSGSPLFAFGQPVILGIRLTNSGNSPIRVPSYLLDVKAGLIEVTIRPLDLSARKHREAQGFTPIVARCFDIAADETRLLRPGEALTDNLNLVFGASGFPFAEPGFYEVAVHLVIYQPSQDRELVASSHPLRIRVAGPQGREEDRDALDLFTNAVGRYFALGGTIQEGVEARLDDILGRRLQREPKGPKGKSPRDPVAVNIIRSRAFRKNRNYHCRVDGALDWPRPPTLKRPSTIWNASTMTRFAYSTKRRPLPRAPIANGWTPAEGAFAHTPREGR